MWTASSLPCKHTQHQLPHTHASALGAPAGTASAACAGTEWTAGRGGRRSPSCAPERWHGQGGGRESQSQMSVQTRPAARSQTEGVKGACNAEGCPRTAATWCTAPLAVTAWVLCAPSVPQWAPSPHLQVLRQLLHAGRQPRNLHLRAAAVAAVALEGRDLGQVGALAAVARAVESRGHKRTGRRVRQEGAGGASWRRAAAAREGGGHGLWWEGE